MAGIYTLPGVLLSGTHSGRPAASAVADGTLYAETDTGQTYQSDGVSTWTAWGAAAGGGGGSGELDYAQVTTGGSITATVEASADTIVSGASVAYDGSTAVIIEFFTLGLTSPGGQTTYLLLFDGSTSLGYIAESNPLTNAPTVYVRRRLTPSLASHTYSFRAIVTGGTGAWQAGAGGAGNNSPTFMRISKA